MSDEELFNEVFKKYGGLWTRTSYTNNHWIESSFIGYKARAVIYVASVAKEPDIMRKPPDIYFNYINSARVAALVARHSEDKYFIGISAGTVLLILMLFQRTLCYKEAFPDIGDNQNEKLDKPSLFDYYQDFDMFWETEQIRTEKDIPYFPNDSERQLFAYHLFIQAMDFLLNHELEHILCGHFGIINDTSIPETSHLISKDDAILSQTLESEADRQSVLLHLKGIEQMIENPNRAFLGFKRNAHFEKYYKTYDDSVYYFCFAIFTLMLLLHNDQLNIHSLTHPTFLLRRRLIAEACAMSKSLEGKLSQHKIVEIVELASGRAAYNYKMITGRSHPQISASSSEIEGLIKQREYLINKWIELAPSLEKYAYHSVSFFW